MTYYICSKCVGHEITEYLFTFYHLYLQLKNFICDKKNILQFCVPASITIKGSKYLLDFLHFTQKTHKKVVHNSTKYTLESFSKNR